MRHPGSIETLVVLNIDSMLTFWRPCYEENIPDVPFTSDELVPSVDGWRFLKDFSGSNHQYIAFEVVYVICARTPAPRSRCTWSVMRMNSGRFFKDLGTGRAPLEISLEVETLQLTFS